MTSSEWQTSERRVATLYDHEYARSVPESAGRNGRYKTFPQLGGRFCRGLPF